VVAWEITKRCNLFCAHCRASADNTQYAGELSLDECRRVIDQVLEVAHPILILSGGEPLFRDDVSEIASYAVGRGLRVVMGTNGTLVDEATAARLRAVPVSRLGISLDFPVPELQDKFRGQPGAFAAAMAGIANARSAGIEVQVNCTVTKLNAALLDQLVGLALEVGAVAFHPFLLVPTGRGKGLESAELSPQEYEDTLNWIYDKQAELGGRIFFKPTDAPHYMRIVSQRQGAGGPPAPQPAPAAARRGHPGNAMTRGCLAGTGFVFISHQGKVKGCGYLDIEAGDLREQSFAQIWNDSPLFGQLRDLSNIKGKCGVCQYKRVCGGCRARAYETTGDCLAAEPYCVYQPSSARQTSSGAADRCHSTTSTER